MGNTAGGLPYSSDEVVSAYTSKQGWTLYQGTAKTDKSSCSIFKYDPKNNGNNTTTNAKNALKYAKTMKHPNVIRCLDGVETSTGEILIVTEPVVPLLEWLSLTRNVETSDASFSAAVTLGLSGVIRALNFLNNDVKICHGLFSHESVFVTSGGDWKLSRFDVAGTIDTAFFDRHGLLSRAYQCPARVSGDRSSLRNMPLHSIDAWSLGVLIRTVYGGEVLRHEDLQNTSKIPKGLLQAYQKLLKGTPEQRLNVNRMLTMKFFQTPLVQSMLFLDEIMIKTPSEKYEFFQSLTKDIDTFPRHVCKYKVLPALTSSLSLGATSGETSMGVAGPIVLVPLLKLGQMLETEEYTKHITPVVLKMFEQQDRGIRVALLSALPQLVDSIDSKLFNTKIFQHICTGFNDTAPQMREMTLKSLPILAPILELAVMNKQLKKVLERSLQDPVPAIRTNATVCLGLLAIKFTKSTIVQLCLPSFTRALRDTFPHNRERALHSIQVTLSLYTDLELGTKILPHVCSSLVDPVHSVRCQGFQCMDLIKNRLFTASEEREKIDLIKRNEMKRMKEKKMLEDHGSGGSGGSGGENNRNNDKRNNSNKSRNSGSSGGSGGSGSGNSRHLTLGGGRNSSSNSSTNSSNSNKSKSKNSNNSSNKSNKSNNSTESDSMWDDFGFDEDNDDKVMQSKSGSSTKRLSTKSREDRRRESENRRADMKKERERKKMARAASVKKKKSNGMQLGGSNNSSSSRTNTSNSLSNLSGINMNGNSTRKTSGSSSSSGLNGMSNADTSMMDSWGGDNANQGNQEDDDMNDLLNFSDDEDEPVQAIKQKVIQKKTAPKTTLDDGGGWGDMDDLDDLLSSPSPVKKTKPIVKSMADRKAERAAKKKERDAKRASKKKPTKKKSNDGWDDDEW